MSIRKHLFTALGRKLADGLFIKLRHAFPHPRLMLKAFKTINAKPSDHGLNERVVLVGIGTAAFSCLRELSAARFRNVTIVTRDELFGGKCVNFGCMPVEFVFSLDSSDQTERRSLLTQFVEGLRIDVRNQFIASGYPLITGTATKVVGRILHLSDGRTLEFDRLIVAIGNDYPKPKLLSSLSSLVPMEDFWTLPPGSRLTIYADGNITALTLAEAAAAQGLIPTVLLAGINPLSAQPSFRHFQRSLEEAGISIFENAQLRQATPTRTVSLVGGTIQTIPHDYVLVCSQPTPQFLEIDGTKPNVFDLDLTHACLPHRPDIVFLGDGGGLLTSSEADMHAKMLVKNWIYGSPLDFRVMGAMPIRLHGRQSLAMVGPEWSLTASGWHETDFRYLGWNKIAKLDGKLWYLLDRDTAMIEAVHICHKQSGDLIGLAAALMRYPVTDPIWMISSVHPSAAEIFKLVAEQATRLLPPPGVSRLGHSLTELEFQLPPIHQLETVGKLPDWLDRDLWFKAILSTDPYKHLAIYFGMSQLEKLSGKTFPRTFTFQSGNRHVISGDDDVSIENYPDLKLCYIRADKYLVTISYGENYER